VGREGEGMWGRTRRERDGRTEGRERKYREAKVSKEGL